MVIKRWVQSYRLLLVAATVFMFGAVAFAIDGFWGVDEMPAGAAIAFIGIAVIGIAAFLIPIPTAWAFRRGGPVKTVAAVVIILGGTFVYASSGFFIGFLPLFLIAVGIGGLALYEEHH